MEMTGAVATSCMGQTLPELRAEPVEHAGPAPLGAARVVGRHVFMSQLQLATRLARHYLRGYARCDFRAVLRREREHQAPGRNDLDVSAAVLDIRPARPLQQTE